MASIVVGAHVSSSGGMFNAIGRGEEIEAEAIQLFASSNRMWRKTKHTPEALQQFRDLREASAIGDVWFHNIYLSNLAADNPEQLEKSIDAVLNGLTICDAVQGQGVVLHTGSHKGLGMEAVQPQVVEALTTILEAAPGDCILALENAAGQGGAIGSAFEELGALIKAVGSPRLQVCFDTCHAFAAGYDVSTTAALDETMGAFDEHIGLDRLAVVHANDSMMGLGDHRDRHANVGDGEIGEDGFRAMLSHASFQGRTLLLEVPGIPTDEHPKGDGPDLENVRRLKKIRDAVAG